MSAFQSRRYEWVERNLQLEVFSFIDALQSNTDFRKGFLSHKIALASFHKSLWAQFCQLYALPIQIDGEATGPDGSNDWFVADSFSFGVEREMKESGEKGGTQDINIGVGELQECTISKSLDKSSSRLAQAAVSGKTLGFCEVCIGESSASGGRRPVTSIT